MWNFNIIWMIFYIKILINRNSFSLSTVSANSLHLNDIFCSVYNDVPIYHKIGLKPQLEDNKFFLNGQVNIELEIKEACTSILLNSDNYNKIDKVFLRNENNTYTCHLNRIDRNFILRFSQSVIEGNYSLYFEYQNIYNYNNFNSSFYTDVYGQKKQIVWTYSFRPGVFQISPCYGCLNYGSTYSFNISIAQTQNYITLLNHEFQTISSGENNSSEMIINLNPHSMTMVAGDFEYLSDEKDEIIRVWTTKNNKDRAKYIVDFAVRALRVIENLTDITYVSAGWQKINFVAVPNISPIEFQPGGLVIINQNYIYANNITIENKEKIFNYITRLYIDQWLMKPMDYKYNKENLSKYDFEQYLKDFIIDKVEKSWRMMDIIFLNEHSHPFEYDNYYNIYETETYAVSHYKYEFLIRMITYILGERKYKSALQSYLQNGSDLSEELIKASGDENGNFEKALKDWLNKTNYPILTISRNYTTQQALLTQMTFLINRIETSSDRYWIPINCATEDNPDFLDTRVTYWFDPSLASLKILAPQNDKWLICNKQRFGIYHVNYDEKNWNLIINCLKSENYNKIHVLNRAQLIDDAFTLAEFGYLNYSIPLKLIGYIKQEIDYIPWIAFWRQICRLHEFSDLKSSEYYDNFKRYVLKQTENIEKRLIPDEIPSNNLSKKLARKLLIKWTCKFDSNLCKNYTLDKLQKWLEDSEKNPIPAELKQEILCGGIRHADQDTWNKLLQKYLSDGDADIMIALSCTSNDEILKNFMISNINDTRGHLESPESKFQIMSRKNDIGIDILLDLIDSNKLGSNHFENHRYDDREAAISQVASYMKTKYQFDKLKKIFENSHSTIASNKVAKYLATAQNRVKETNAQFHLLEEFLTSNNFNNTI